MIGRADIEGSKSNVAMNAWLPQASSLIPGLFLFFKKKTPDVSDLLILYHQPPFDGESTVPKTYFFLFNRPTPFHR